MKQIILLALLAICLFNTSFGQDREMYLELIKDAQILYENSEFEISGQKYSEAFIAFGNQGERKHRYKAACAWAMSSKIDSSYVQLYKISKNGSYSDYNYITTDSRLNSLHQDKRWKEVIAFVVRNQKRKIKADAKLDKDLVVKLDTIFKRDRTPRLEIRQIEQKYGRKSEQMRAHWKVMAKADSTNVVEIVRILDNRGWLGSDVIGSQGNKTLYLVVQHSDLKTQERYLPMMRKAVKKSNARARDLAFLEDRVASGQGKKQIYGTQMGRNKETGEYFVKSLIDPDNVDRRREKIGLGTLANYYCHGRITWDLEKHKMRIAKTVK
jgi:hypothetical protein